MKGVVYGNRLPRGRHMKKGWEPPDYTSNIWRRVQDMQASLWSFSLYPSDNFFVCSGSPLVVRRQVLHP
jgi:hypothetical protein